MSAASESPAVSISTGATTAIPSSTVGGCTSAENTSPIALPIMPATAPFAAPTAAVLPMSATVPPAAALIALSTTVLNIAVVPIIPSTAGPPAPATPIPIVITVIIKPLNAAMSSSFSID